jgi:hypothetical protein
VGVLSTAAPLVVALVKLQEIASTANAAKSKKFFRLCIFCPYLSALGYKKPRAIVPGRVVFWFVLLVEFSEDQAVRPDCLV